MSGDRVDVRPLCTTPARGGGRVESVNSAAVPEDRPRTDARPVGSETQRAQGAVAFAEDVILAAAARGYDVMMLAPGRVELAPSVRTAFAKHTTVTIESPLLSGRLIRSLLVELQEPEPAADAS